MQKVKICSACELTEKQRDKIEEEVLRLRNEDLDFEYCIDTEILGGFSIKIGDQVIDLTVNAQIAEIKNFLASK